MLTFWLMLAVSLPALQDLLIPRSGGASRPSIIHVPLVQVWMALLVISQGVLMIRVKPAEGRPKARRSIWPAVVASAFCFAMLSGSLAFTLSAGITGDKGLERFTEAGKEMAKWIGRPRWEESLLGIAFFGFLAGLWAVWWIILSRQARSGSAPDLVVRWTQWLLAGSVLELLISIPCHIIARRRDDCCAPILTFWGLAMGWAILILSVGPAVILLVEQRLARKQARPAVPTDPGAPPRT
jgi:hypothetical protein